MEKRKENIEDNPKLGHKEKLLIKYYHGELSFEELNIFNKLREEDAEFAKSVEFEDKLLQMRFQERWEEIFDSISKEIAIEIKDNLLINKNLDKL